MRTNIDLDNETLRKAYAYSDAKTKRALVHEALQTYIQVKSEEKKRSAYEQQLHEFREKTAVPPLKSDSRDLIRQDRDQR